MGLLHSPQQVDAEGAVNDRDEKLKVAADDLEYRRVSVEDADAFISLTVDLKRVLHRLSKQDA